MKKMILIFIAFVSITSCSSDNAETKTNIQLYDKPLPVIKSYIEGSWELHYAKGGIDATMVQYYENYFWKFDFSNGQDRIKVIYDGKITTDTTITWVLNQGTFTEGDSTYVMIISGGGGYIIDGVYNDTLVIHNYAADGRFFHLTQYQSKP